MSVGRLYPVKSNPRRFLKSSRSSSNSSPAVSLLIPPRRTPEQSRRYVVRALVKNSAENHIAQGLGAAGDVLLLVGVAGDGGLAARLFGAGDQSAEQRST